MFGQDSVHISKVVINKSFDQVWKSLSHPENYKKLYPNWIKNIKSTGDSRFLADDQFGNSYFVETVLDKAHGVIDLKIGAEVSRARLVPLDDSSTALIHVAKKWNNVGVVGWFFHKRTTAKDLRNAKRVIETETNN